MFFKFYLHFRQLHWTYKKMDPITVLIRLILRRWMENFTGLKSPQDPFSIFLDAVHYGSPSGGGGWHSLYNLGTDDGVRSLTPRFLAEF